MTIAAVQLSSFYSYRYFVPPITVKPILPKNGAVEEKVQVKVAEGDSAFADRRYSVSLAAYLEAYALLHHLLHPDFPVDVVVTNPSLLDKLDIFKPLITTVVTVARFRDRTASLPIVATIDLSPEYWDIMKSQTVGIHTAMQPAQLAFQAATNYLQIGAVEQAEKFLNMAQEINQGRDPLLDAHVSATVGAIHVVRRDLNTAESALKRAKDLYNRLGMSSAQATVDNNTGVLFTQLGNDERSGSAFKSAANLLPQSMDKTLSQNLNSSAAAAMVRPMGIPGLDLMVPAMRGKWVRVSSTMADKTVDREILRVRMGDGVKQIELVDGAENQLLDSVYSPRKDINDLQLLNPHLELPYNLLAYLPHLYGFILPMDIGDCYAALGRRQESINYYLKARNYPFLNSLFEVPQLWIKLARAITEEADHYFRNMDPSTAKSWYEQILNSDNTVPSGSQLYQGANFVQMVAVVNNVISAMDDGVATFGGNYEVASLIAYVRGRLAKISSNLNWLGLDDDMVPIWNFDFLQATARYFAQHAIQAWREYVSYKSAAEQAEMTERDLEQAVTMNWYAVQTQKSQQELANRQFSVVQGLLDGAVLHRDNLATSRDQFDTDGWVIAELNRFQSWYSNSKATDIFESGHWDWGGGRELAIGEVTAQQAIDAVIDYRNRLSHGMQIDNFNRQIAEANNQITVAERQLAVAQSQQEIARWQTWASERQLDFARENLNFFREREFTPDLWHALADRLREVANQYLEMGIHAAFLMERAYAAENDRDLHRIRFNYVSPGVGELTAGDALLLDIDSFTHDLLVHEKGRRNRVRHVISLADLAPQAFTQFLRTGEMTFTIPLWVLERVYPGTYLHRIQSVEVEIEGLQVPEGITGSITHMGISEWRRGDGTVQSRVTVPETMNLSGFRLRRDASLFRADPARLNLFENSGTAASWRLQLPPSTNDVDFTTISDIRLVLYFYCLHDPTLEATIRAGFPSSGESAQSFSARLHAPDQYFAFGPPPDGSNKITFSLPPKVFPYNQRNLRTSEIGVQILQTSDTGIARPFPGVALVLRMSGQSGSGLTDVNGTLATVAGSGDLSSLVNQTVGDVEIEFTGSADERAKVADIFLLLNYKFDYRG